LINFAIFHFFLLLRACGAVFLTVLGGWYGSNRPMTAFQAVSSSVEAVLDALFIYFLYFFIKKDGYFLFIINLFDLLYI
jgi:hypothetical protein